MSALRRLHRINVSLVALGFGYAFLYVPILLVMFVKTAYDSMDPEYGSGSSVGGVGMVFILGMGVILLGMLSMLVMARIRPEFFRGEVLARGL